MLLTRRKLLKGLFAAPAIVAPSSLMPIVVRKPEHDFARDATWNGERRVLKTAAEQHGW